MDRAIVPDRVVGVAIFAFVGFLMWHRPDDRLSFGIIAAAMLLGRDPWWLSHRRLAMRDVVVLAIVCVPIVSFALDASPFVQGATLVISAMLVLGVKKPAVR